MKTTFIAIFWLGRPLILSGVLMVHVGGVAAAYAAGYPLDGTAFLWAFVSLFFVGLSVNYVNEYADYETDALTERTRYSGGSGVLPGGTVPRSLALKAGWVTLLLGLGSASLGAIAGVLEWPAAGVLALGGVGGWMYSLPPLKLAWNGGAEAANALLGGIILPLYGYAAQSGRVDGWVVAAFIPYALLIFTTAMATTWPDREADAEVGKRTLATWMPVCGLRIIYFALSVASFLLLPLLVGWALPIEVITASLVAIPGVILGALAYTRIRNPHPTARAGMMLMIAQTTAWFWLGAVHQGLI